VVLLINYNVIKL